MEELKKIFKKHKLVIILFVLALFTYISIFVLVSIPAKIMDVYLTKDCTESVKWAEHMDQFGYKTKLHYVDNVEEYKTKFGVPASIRACHTAYYEGYVLEGHVPAQVLTEIIDAQSDALGLGVNGKPVGAPGLEGGYPERFEVIMFNKEGDTKVFRIINDSYHK